VKINRLAPAVGAVLLAGAVAYALLRPRSTVLTLTGIVTTNDVIVSSQVAGQVSRLLVSEGDTVSANQLVALIAPAELAADQAYFAHSAEGYASQVRQSEAALRYEERGSAQQVRQAEAMLAASEAQRAEAAAALEDANITFKRMVPLVSGGAAAAQELDHARTTLAAARSRVDALDRQVQAQRAALALARANAEQVAIRRDALVASRQQRDAAEAQRAKADVRMGYTEIRAPIAGIVDVRAIRAGEFANPGEPIVSLINPDDLWVRADVEESYIDRIRLGDRLMVRFPSGLERPGTVFFRGVDGAFATQRDVSRTKRDIKTFEIRLRLDNADRRMAVGMTAYVLLPVTR
jgi:multidrug resistance efflux pump